MSDICIWTYSDEAGPYRSYYPVYIPLIIYVYITFDLFYSQRKESASAIFQTHLSKIAPEPVNIDSHAAKKAEEHLGHPNQAMFDEAQNQVCNHGNESTSVPHRISNMS